MLQDKQYDETVMKLRREKDFLAYLKLLKEVAPKFTIFITVADTGAGPYYTPQHAAAMADLGLKINMLNRYRAPYIAIINKGKVIQELTSDKIDEPIIIGGKISYHDCETYSAGFNYQVGIGSGAFVRFDGTNFSVGGRGFNFLVFDVEQDEVVDTRGFDTFEDAKCFGGDKDYNKQKILSFVHKWGGYSFLRSSRRDFRLNVTEICRIGKSSFGNKNLSKRTLSKVARLR